MRLSRVSIRNYKSLKEFDLEPGDLSVLVGANASGKSNFADCIDFISEIYRHGLEVAVGRKGGYENIAFRKIRRSKQAIGIRISVDIGASDWRGAFHGTRGPFPQIRVDHSFSFVASDSSIRAEFEISHEEIVFSDAQMRGPLVTIRRKGEGLEIEPPQAVPSPQKAGNFESRLLDFSNLRFFMDRSQKLAKTDLIATVLAHFAPAMRAFSQAVEGIRIFQISPTKSREFGVPTPSPELDRSGANLPAVVNVMQKRHPTAWREVLSAMRHVLPNLASIGVGYTSNRTLGLNFEEADSGRPWSVDEISDGTVQTLALLVAIFNPGFTALVLEEPENSVHPWIIRHILDACQSASKEKQIILTTHSPVVMNAVRPEQMWVLWRKDGETHVAPMTKIAAEFLPMWKEGKLATFDYIDSGAVLEAIPPSPSTGGDDE